MTVSYTRDGSEEFNHRLNDALTRIADRVESDMGPNLVSLILGGGYGRGEGGIVIRDGKEFPYNDLDFTLVVEDKSSVPFERLKAVSDEFAGELGIHVDFSRPLTVRDIRNWPRWMMWHDLVNGHFALKGPPDLLTKNAPADLLAPLPVIEATRLLLNRGAGVLWSLRVARGLEKEPDADFVRRNYYKCALALGDSLLIAFGKYTTRYYGRDMLLAGLAKSESDVEKLHLGDLYDEALRFKFRPDAVSGESKSETQILRLSETWGKVFLLVETVRTKVSWRSLDEYVAWHGIREQDQHTLKLFLRNLVRNLGMGRLSLKYPREQLYRQLPVLLGLVKRASANWPEESLTFLQTWDRFN